MITEIKGRVSRGLIAHRVQVCYILITAQYDRQVVFQTRSYVRKQGALALCVVNHWGSGLLWTDIVVGGTCSTRVRIPLKRQQSIIAFDQHVSSCYREQTNLNILCGSCPKVIFQIVTSVACPERPSADSVILHVWRCPEDPEDLAKVIFGDDKYPMVLSWLIILVMGGPALVENSSALPAVLAPVDRGSIKCCRICPFLQLR